MSWSGDDRGGKRGYHHGDLKEALIRAALDLIKRHGPAGFTFADVPAWAGVCAPAPYRHFRDRDALMVDVARRGFERFEAELARAWNDGRPDPLTAYQNVGRAYLGFARSDASYYSAMFEAGLAPDADPELQQSGERAFAVLRRASEAVAALLPKEKRPPALMMSLHIWSLSHGIASLFARGDAGRRRLPMSPEDLLEAAVLIYLQGLGLHGGKT